MNRAAINTSTSEASAPLTGSAFTANLDRLWAQLPRLRGTGLSSESAGRLSDHVAALRFLLHSGEDRPLLAGLVGGASCGKSTLFDSVVGRRLSRIHYQPHSSLGPIISVHRRHRAVLLPEALTRVFLPDMTAAEATEENDEICGTVDGVAVAFHSDARWDHVALVDLPDITSESARREGWLVRRLLPWMDLVIWMVDPNDYLFEDLYIDLIDAVGALGQRSIVVVNDIHGQVRSAGASCNEPLIPVLRERIDRFRPEGWFVLPPLQCSAREPYPLFHNEPGFLKLREFLLAYRAARPLAPLAARVCHEAAAVLHANAEWARLTRELTTSTSRLVARQRKRILATAPVLSVLPEPARQELERLRNRLSLVHQVGGLFRMLRSPAGAVGRALTRQIQLTPDDLDTEPLYRHLVGSLKEFGVDLHHAYLESQLVQELQQSDPRYEVLGPFDPESLDFKARLDALAQRLFTGTQEVLNDPSLWKDKRFHFMVGAGGVALAFLMFQSLLGVAGIALLVGKGITALAGLVTPEIARYLPIDRISRLARESRDMLVAIVDEQMRKMVDFYTAARGQYLEPGDSLLAALASLQADSFMEAEVAPLPHADSPAR